MEERQIDQRYHHIKDFKQDQNDWSLLIALEAWNKVVMFPKGEEYFTNQT